MKTTPPSLIVVTFYCLSAVVCADSSLADKSLAMIDSNFSTIASSAMPDTPPKPKKASPLLIKNPSKVESLIEKSLYIHTGTNFFGNTDLFGKNVSPVMSKGAVGLQYSTQW